MERGIRFRSEEEEIVNGRTDLRDVDWLVELAGEDVLCGGVLVLGELDVARRVAAGGVLRHGHRPRTRSRRRRRRRRERRPQSDQMEWNGICLPSREEEEEGRPLGLLLSYGPLLGLRISSFPMGLCWACGSPPFLWATGIFLSYR
jgi:hypothetical protein